MTAMRGPTGSLVDMSEELIRLANKQFDSVAAQRLLGLRFNKKRAAAYIIQRTHFVENRRQCWAQVQSSSPMPVKPIIWDHEREELEGNKALGSANHYMLSQQEGAAVGVTPDDFERVGMSDGTLACCYAWLHLARNTHWLKALAASAALELSNSDEILTGGGMSRRIGIKMRDEVGIPLEKQPSNAEHMVADVKHAHMLMEIAEHYAKDERSRAKILDGARQSWAIDRTWKAHMADVLSAIPE